MAAEAGFVGLSMRASAVSVDTPKPRIHEIRALLDRYGLSASMVMGNVPLAANSPDAPSCLRNITSHLELAEILGTTLVRVMIQTAADIPFAQRAADEAGKRGIVLAQQTHWGTLAETVDETLDLMLRIERPNFGVTFEPANLLACGDNNGPDALRHLMPYLVNFYFQNIRLDPSGAHTFMTRTRGPVSLSYLPLDDPLGMDFSSDRRFKGMATPVGLRFINLFATVNLLKMRSPKPPAYSFRSLPKLANLDHPLTEHPLRGPQWRK